MSLSCKVVVVGDGYVGKRRFAEIANIGNYATNKTVDGRLVNVSLWDTNAQDEYDRLRPLSYHDTGVFIVAYSMAGHASFDNVIEKWIPEISFHCPGTPFVLVATKADLRENGIGHTLRDQRGLEILAEQGKSLITTEQGHDLAKKIGALGFFEVSSIQMRGVDEVMEHVYKVGVGLIGLEEEPQKPPKPDPPSCVPGPEICDDLEMIVNDKLFHDVVFCVEDEKIYGHKFVLCSASPLLSQLILEHQPVDKYFTCKADNDICIVSVSHVSHVELLEFVRFVYSGKPKQSPTHEFIQLAKVCGIEYNINRRPQMASAILGKVKIMHDIEIVANDGKKFNAIKALLWCRSEHFKSQITDPTMKKLNVDISSRLLIRFLDYANEGFLKSPFDEDLITLAKNWSSGMLRSIAYTLVSSEINMKNVFEWIARTRDVFPEVHNYCVWLLQVNHSAIKDRLDFHRLKEKAEVAAGAWPGVAFESRYKKWKALHGKKKDGDRCLVQ